MEFSLHSRTERSDVTDELIELRPVREKVSLRPSAFSA